MSTVLVIGDAMVDCRVSGVIQRIASEAPAPVVLETSRHYSPGGAANTLCNLLAMGVPADFVSSIGNDPEGEWLHAELHHRSTNKVWLRTGDSPTTVKTRVMVGQHHVIRLDREQRMRTALTVEQLTETLQCGKRWAVVVSDYNKGLLHEQTRKLLVQWTQQHGVPLFVDAKPAVLADWSGASWLKINQSEALEFTQTLPLHLTTLAGEEEAVTYAAQQLREKLAIPYVIVTRGERGALLARGAGVEKFHCEPKHVFDVTGAGDVFLANFVAALWYGETVDKAVNTAQIAAGLSVQEPGSVVISRDQLEDAKLTHGGSEAKIMDLRSVVAFADRCRKKGKSVVVTNGCFDTLHHGH